MYHGTDYPIEEFDLTDVNPSTGAFDVCLTYSESIAKMYATRFGMGGTVITFDLDAGLRIATKEEALQALGFDRPEEMTTSDTFHAIDSGRNALVAAGFDGVEYEDCLPGTADVFDCIRIYKEGSLTIEDSYEV